MSNIAFRAEVRSVSNSNFVPNVSVVPMICAEHISSCAELALCAENISGPNMIVPNIRQPVPNIFRCRTSFGAEVVCAEHTSSRRNIFTNEMD